MHFVINLSASLAIALLVLGPQSSRPIFDEVAAETGLNFRHYNGMTG